MKDLTTAERTMLETIATAPSGPEIGLNGQALGREQWDAWLELFKDGLADGVLDDAGNNWLVLTDRGQKLWKTGTTT